MEHVEQGMCSFLATSKIFLFLLIMPSISRTEASAARAIYSSHVAATQSTCKELPSLQVELPWEQLSLRQLCTPSIFFQEHFKVLAKAIHIKPSMFWVLASLELISLCPLKAHETSWKVLLLFAILKTWKKGLAPASGAHTTSPEHH